MQDIVLLIHFADALKSIIRKRHRNIRKTLKNSTPKFKFGMLFSLFKP